MYTATSPITQEAGSPPVGRRAAARLRLAIPARFISIHATQNGILLDISRSGARFGVVYPPAVGHAGYLGISRFQVFSTVIRLDRGIGGGVIGMAFDDPLTEAQVLEIRHFAEQFETNQREGLREQVRRWVTGEP